MAIVRSLEARSLEKDSPHLEVKCTYSVIVESNGTKHLQLDTYGSTGRKLKGKKSQSIRLAPEAVMELKAILDKHFPRSLR